MDIKKYLNKDSIIDMLTRYELYYEIGLANFIYETIQDIDDAYVKLEELDLEVESDVALSNIIEVILHYSHTDNFDEILDFYIRSRALLHALKDFVNRDKELLNKESYVEQKTQQIKNDNYFTNEMKVQLESEYMDVVEKYELIVTDEVVNALNHNISNN
jgi:hypothetical protein